MKKFITLTFAAMLCIGGFADHLKFKGIEIDSTIQYFCKQLETKGFVKSEDFESEKSLLDIKAILYPKNNTTFPFVCFLVSTALL